MFGRTSKTERQQMLDRLHELRREYAGTMAGRRVDDFLMYATIGKDRKKLGMDWARRAEKAVKGAADFERTLKEMVE